MDKLKELINSMREILDLADLEDEVKERGETTLQEVETLFDEETKREVEPEEVTPEEVREVVDLTPVVTELTEAVKSLAEGQREIVESLKAKEVEEVAETEESREVEVEEEVTPEPDPSEQRFTKLEDMLSDLTKTVKEAVPVRRGVGPNDEKEEDTPSTEELIEREIEAEEDPEMRLRKRLGHYSNERPIVI